MNIYVYIYIYTVSSSVALFFWHLLVLKGFVLHCHVAAMLVSRNYNSQCALNRWCARRLESKLLFASPGTTEPTVATAARQSRESTPTRRPAVPKVRCLWFSLRLFSKLRSDSTLWVVVADGNWDSVAKRGTRKERRQKDGNGECKATLLTAATKLAVMGSTVNYKPAERKVCTSRCVVLRRWTAAVFWYISFSVASKLVPWLETKRELELFLTYAVNEIAFDQKGRWLYYCYDCGLGNSALRWIHAMPSFASP